MRIVFFTKGSRIFPSSRYRGFFIAQELGRRGYDVAIYPTEKRGVISFIHYLRIIMAYRRCDVFYLQRTIYNKYFTGAVLVGRLFGRKFVFDLDDAVFEHSHRKTVMFVKTARGVTCGTHYTLAWARKHARAVCFLPNGIPADLYFPHSKKYPVRDKKEVTIGWIGDGPVHKENLSILKGVFEELISRGHKFVFTLIGSQNKKDVHALFESVRGLKTVFIPQLDWSRPSVAARHIASFDIGVTPLLNTSWNQGKHFKTLEYMACGVPPVVSSLDEHRYIVCDGKNGMLAACEAEWVDKLEELLLSPSLREQMGLAAQEHIRRNRTTKQSADTLEEFIIGLAGVNRGGS